MRSRITENKTVAVNRGPDENIKIQELRDVSNPALQAVDQEHRDGRFVELNVVEQMKQIQKFPEIKRAMEERGLRIHGLVYSRTWNKAVKIELPGEERDWLTS
ncbi:uncharacterized protein PpBr36_06200 [Pyricularia pennisetigena]|uniref:uncharacterized protein n=1 Tax=Pyricularia pennisetigena TaxID=1578925 RepID=UPI00115488CC|nr:uncharacterized protein PpBr36_06200 [Pyricularia pennisetigena]TLS23065.1 hypothetical protein PpBr36_06200 [Pyricularia pennisetigena]